MSIAVLGGASPWGAAFLIQMPTASVLATPLRGQVLGRDDGQFVLGDWMDQGGPASPPAPPRYIAPLHVHRTEDEAWYVLEGTLRFRLGDEEVEAPAGAAVRAPWGVSHTYWNPGPGPARYLVVMGPRTHRLVAAIHAATDRTPAALRALFRRFDSELLV